MAQFFDPHVCTPPNISELAVPIEKSWTCVHCGRHWGLEHFRSVAGDYLGSSWILVETPIQALSIGSFLIEAGELTAC